VGERRGLIAVVSGAVTGRFNVGTTAVAIGNVLKIVTVKNKLKKKSLKKSWQKKFYSIFRNMKRSVATTSETSSSKRSKTERLRLLYVAGAPGNIPGEKEGVISNEKKSRKCRCAEN